jgi:Ca2+-binding RTX toxin-like protein
MATVNGNDNANILTGSASNDTLNGLGGNDTLYGNGGDDTLDGGTGNDLLVGGRGSDTYRFGQGYGFDVIDNSGGANNDVDTLLLTNLNTNQIRLTRIGNDLVLSVLASGETLTVSQNFLDADHGIDRIQFADGSRWSASVMLANLYYPPVVPTNGADVINGNPDDDSLLGLGGDDTLYGNSGNDTLDGGSGNDRMEGGVGNDTYVVDAAGDVVVEANNAGDDLVQASISYTLGGNVERLTLTGSANLNGVGNSLANTLIGNAGNNLLDGGAGADSMAGGSGDDTYIVDQSGDSLSELAGGGNDTVRVSLNYSLGANLENLELTGSSNLNGTGNALANRLIGNAGNNLLDGGAGDDFLAGRRGNDTYRYGTNYGNDVIDNSGGANADVDTVQLVGLNSSNVSFVHTGNDLQMVVLATSQTLTLKNFYLGADYEIDQLRFGNNVVWNTAALKAAATSPANVAPSSTNDSQTTLEDTPVILGSADFGTYSDPENTPLAAVKITSLPLLGSLQYNNGSAWGAVVQDQVISKADLDAGKLQFVPALNGNGSGYVSIGFKVSDGAAFAVSANTLSIDVTSVNDAPTVSGPVSLPDGVEDSAYTFTAAQLLANASDVDVGDSLSVQSVNVDPADGSITANPDGIWTFTPALDRNGLVSFALVIADSAGATVATSANLSLAPVDDAPAAVATVTALSDDSGIAGDFITNIESQTVSGTYTGTLNTGETIQVSADGGTTWVNAAADSATHSWSTSGVTLISSGTGLLVQTINATGNNRAGTGHSYTLDTSADVGNDLRVMLDDSRINNAEKTAVAYTVTGLDADASATITFSDATKNHVVGVNGSADLSSLSDGPINVSIVATDVAGNSAGNSPSSPTKTLTFDDVPSGSLTSNYGGVSFSGARIVPSSPVLPSHSGTQLAYSDGFMIVTFNSGNIQTVSAYVSGEAQTGFYAFNAAGALVGLALLAEDAVNTLLTVTSPGDPIVRLDIHDGGSPLAVDDLTFTSAGSVTLDTSADMGGNLTVTLADSLINNAEKTAVAYTVTGLDADATATVSFSDGSQNVVGVNGSANLSSLSDGPISVSVTASDTAGNTANGTGSTFTLDTIAPLVSGPVTLAGGTEDSAYTFSAAQLLANSSDIGNTPSVKSVNVSPNDGTLTDHGDGSWTFAPAANRNGAVAFNVVVTDGGNDVATSANLSLAPVNDAPVVSTPSALPSGTEDTAYSITTAQLLVNASDVDGDALSIANLSANHGTLADNGEGSWIFTPDANYHGAVTLNYQVIDGNGGSVNTNQGFSLTAINDAPTGAVAISGNATAGQTLSVSNSLADVDGLGIIGYQWQHSSDGNSWSSIASATGNTYTLSAAEVGQQVRVEARYIDDGGTAEVVASAATTAVAAQFNLIEGGAGDDLMTGTASADRLLGYGGNDTLFGLAGDDELDGGAGNDRLDGGAGNDSAVYSANMNQYIVTFDPHGYLAVEAGVGSAEAGRDHINAVEQLRFANGTITVNGSPGAEVLVNTTTANDQLSPSITALAGGDYVVIWHAANLIGEGYDIYAQRYDANGNALGGEALVNGFLANNQSNPSVAGLAGGGYVVTWQSFGQDGNLSGIYAQRYDAGGVAQGGEVRVNTFIGNDQVSSSVAALTNGGYVVSWMSMGQDGNSWGVYVQRYAASGAAVGGEVRVNSNTFGSQEQPAIAALSDGGYVVTWMSSGDGSGWGIYSQRYNASGVATSGEVPVNTFTTNDQAYPSVAALVNGGYVVSWMSLGQDGSGYGVYAQRYDASGATAGGEVRVNSTTFDSQQQPVIAALSSGGYVVSWMSNGQDGSGWGIYAQHYDASGVAVGGEVQVNSATFISQQQPTIAALSDGGYVMSWMSGDQDGSGWGIYAQRYDASGQAVANTLTLTGDTGDNLVQLGSGDERIAGGGGNDTLFGGEGHDTALYQGSQHDFAIGAQRVDQISVTDLNPADGNEGVDTLHNFETLQFGEGVRLQALGGEMRVNSTTLGGQGEPVIGTLSDGGYVVCWSSFGQDGSGNGVYAQRYGASGAAVGGEVRVNSTTFDNQMSPTIDGLSDGGYVVSWMSYAQDGSNWGIYAQRYGASGAAVGGEVRVNSTTFDTQQQPTIGSLSDGGYVVCWSSIGQDGSGNGVYAQRYGASGAAVGGEVRVNSTTLDHQQSPVIDGLSDGGYVVSWMSNVQDGSSFGIYAQRYDASGAAVGGEVRVNSTTLDSQQGPAIGALSDGGYVVSWMSNAQDGSGWGIYAQRYNASGAAVGGEVRVNSTTLDSQQEPAIGALSDGGYVVSWMSYGQDGSGPGIYSQRYDTSGAAAGGEVRVNSTTFDSQYQPAISALSDGGYVVSWTSNGQDGSSSGIYSQRYDASGNPVTDHLEWTGDFSANLIRSTLETDWFNGGTGADTFQFAQLPGDRADLITDFSLGSDVLALNSGLFNLQGQTVAEALANVSGAQNEVAGAHLVFNQNDQTLYYDADGAANGNAVAVVTLVGVANLAASDLQLFG